MDISNKDIEDLGMLKRMLKNGTINWNELREDYKNMERKKILEEHPYKIWKATDGRYKTKVRKELGGKKSIIAKTKKSDLEQAIVDIYKDRDNATQKDSKKENLTLKELYLEWIEYKSINTRASSYVKRISSDWVTFYESDEEFANTKISDFDVIGLDKWFHTMIKEHDMTRKKFYNMAVIMKQSMAYAKQKGYIEINPYKEVIINSKLFKRNKKKTGDTEVFKKEEMEKIIEYLLSRSDDILTLGLILLFDTGLRIGELVALKPEDVLDDTLKVQRQEVTRYKHQKGKVKNLFAGYEVVDYTKTTDGCREVYLTERSREIINIILAVNATKEDCDDYLFVNELGKRVNQCKMRDKLYKACDAIDIPRKSPHKARKTNISLKIDGGISIDEIRRQAGHADERTTYKSYCYNRCSDEETNNQIENALVYNGNKKSDEPTNSPPLNENVTHCNPKSTKIVKFRSAKKPVKSRVMEL